MAQESLSSIPYAYYIIDGKVYDLREWIGKHPGGSVWFSRCNGRDISAVVHAYHNDPEKLKRILRKYEVPVAVEDARNPSLNVPPFVLPEGFDANKHTPVYGWDERSGFLSSLRRKINTPVMQKRIAQADALFDFVGIFVFILHVFMMFVGVCYAVLPVWCFVILFAVTRTSLASVGHYHCHRKKDGVADWGDALFDMNYVGASLVLWEGHVLGHHLYTNSVADQKRTVFTGMLNLPRLWRVPVFTLHRFGQFLTGMWIKWRSMGWDLGHRGTEGKPLRFIQIATVRLLLLAEFIFCCATGYAVMWFAQFFLSLWWNQFLIVSSHDFEESETKADLSPGQDWGVFQVKNSFDMSIVGNRYVDCFLTAGLGSHRVHHVLPAQRSGFSNILSEPAVRSTCDEFHLPWNATKNFIFDRLPGLVAFYLSTPARFALARSSKDRAGEMSLLREAFAWEGCRPMARFILSGFNGVGSI